MKQIASIIKGPAFHMVGDGFRVKNYIAPGSALSKKTSPYLLLDYLPEQIQPPTTNEKRGVGPHPHRGFETVSLSFAGSVVHKDSAGNGGVIGPGDVQWMTAGSGILHSEYHEKEFARKGGPMHFMQIWVNLPAKKKMHPPRYQALTAAEMGRAKLPDGSGEVCIIAGSYQEAKGPAQTFTPINLFDIRFKSGGRADFSFPATENTLLMILSGDVSINGEKVLEHDLVLFANEGEKIEVKAESEAHLVLLNGEPIDEPMAAYGPFVMNTEEEIIQAVNDYRSGKFGNLSD